MRFTIVTCTYNRAAMLSDTLQSLALLQFDNSKFEVILVDNNSTDDTQQVFYRFAEKYPGVNFRYVKELNQGLSFALNRGIEEAKGEYICFIDDDEAVDRVYLKRLDSYLSLNPQIKYAASRIVPLYEGGEPKWMSAFTQRLIGGYFNAGDRIKKLGKGKYPGTGHTIIKKSLYDRFGKYNTNLGRKGKGLMGAEDKDMAFRLLNGGVECYYLPIPVFHQIPAEKLTDDFFDRLTYSIGKSERIRTQHRSTSAYAERLFDEAIKWAASCILCLFYLIKLQPSKGFRLLRFRWNVSKGLLGK